MRNRSIFGLLIVLMSVNLYSQCTMANYLSAYRIPSNAYPYFSASAGITVSVTTVNTPTLNDVAYTCAGNNYSGSSPAWWLNSSTGQIRLTFSAPVTNLTILVNGTNQTEIFYFAAGTGAISLSNYCTAGWVPSGSQISYTAVATVGSIITVNNPTGSTTYTLSHNGLGSGSRYTLLDCFLKLTLPIELSSFNGKCSKDIVELEWETETERNNKNFTVERSSDGKDWEEIGSVPGAGNSATPKFYSFTDDKPNASLLYYRIRQTDFDETSSFSPIITVNSCKRISEVIVYPNPAKDEFIISGDVNGHIELLDALGVMQMDKTISSEDDLKISVSHLSSGIYFLRVGDKTLKLVKE